MKRVMRSVLLICFSALISTKAGGESCSEHRSEGPKFVRLEQASQFLSEASKNLYPHQKSMMHYFVDYASDSAMTDYAALYAMNALLPFLETFPDPAMSLDLPIAIRNLKCFNERHGVIWPRSFQRAKRNFPRNVSLLRDILSAAKPLMTHDQKKTHEAIEEIFSAVGSSLSSGRYDVAQNKLRREKARIATLLGSLSKHPLLTWYGRIGTRLLESLVWEES